jgi:hypothetical protein
MRLNKLRSLYSSRRVALCALFAMLAAASPEARIADQSKRAATSLPDLSGLAWVEGDTFLALHDAKNPEEISLPRASLMWLPKSGNTLTWKPLDVKWPEPLGPSGDLESIARIPGTRYFLLAESGEGTHEGKRFGRIFLAELDGDDLKIVSFINWPVPVTNIEGMAAARINERFVLLFAERADNQPSTIVRYADLQIEPLRVGRVRQTVFTSAGFSGPMMRPVSAIEVDDRGRIYISSAFDPDDDNGPFRSRICEAGRIRESRGGIAIEFYRAPRNLVTLDGLKVESLAVRHSRAKSRELFFGTDDENYGGALRYVPLN